MVDSLIEKAIFENYKSNCSINLILEKNLIEQKFNWLKLKIVNKSIIAEGKLYLGKKWFEIEIYYSPLYPYRFDRIFIKNEKIIFDDRIHVYGDLSLCLYHPQIDKSPFEIIPLYKLIPRVTEWCIHYENFKLYKVWLGKEIKH